MKTMSHCFRRALLCVLFGLSSLWFAACGFAAERTLLLLGQKPDGHPAGTHEYMAAQRIVQHILKDVPGLKTEIVQADDPWSEGPEWLARADGVVLFVSEGAKWISADPRRYEAFARLAQREAGFTVFHWGTGTKDAANIAPFVRLFGACHGGPDRKYTFFDEIEINFTPDHPITAGLSPLQLREEYYYRLKRAPADAGKITPLVTIPADAESAGERQMVGWSFDRTDGGRSFGFTGLHFHANWQQPTYRRLLAQGILWTLQLPAPDEAIKALNLDVPAALLNLEPVK